MKDQFGGWGGGEKLTRSGTWGRCSHNYTHASQRYLQTGYNRCHCSRCCDQIFEDKECCLLQMKCMISASVEIIFYWAWLIISVWEKEPKLKETTVNHFALRHYWCIHVQWAQWVSKAIRQNRMGFSYIFSWRRYDCLPHCFSSTFQPPLFSVENLKK